MNCRSYNKFFEVFANKTRLKIIHELMHSSKCVGEICHLIGEEQSKVSHNLKVLTNCHFVECIPKGKKRVYQLNKKTIVPLMEHVKEHVEGNCNKRCWVKS